MECVKNKIIKKKLFHDILSFEFFFETDISNFGFWIGFALQEKKIYNAYGIISIDFNKSVIVPIYAK